uniref:Uncharacterized protein n=1 Tax=Anopheles melas TaxID=34690 RepID=A0A182UDX2_9DIPT
MKSPNSLAAASTKLVALPNSFPGSWSMIVPSGLNCGTSSSSGRELLSARGFICGPAVVVGGAGVVVVVIVVASIRRANAGLRAFLSCSSRSRTALAAAHSSGRYLRFARYTSSPTASCGEAKHQQVLDLLDWRSMRESCESTTVDRVPMTNVRYQTPAARDRRGMKFAVSHACKRT